MSKPYLTVKEFYEEVNKRKTKQKELSRFFQDIDKYYTIPNVQPPDQEKCPNNLHESYIVNGSKKRYHHELDRSHFLIHWGYLCHFPEVVDNLKLVYNKIKSNRSQLINTLYDITDDIGSKEIIINSSISDDSHLKKYFTQINNLLDLGRNKIVRFKISNQTLGSRPDVSNPMHKKMTINFSIIIKLSKPHPRNLISCPLEKTIVADRHKKIKRRRYNFVCHPDNMNYRLETDNILLSVWLLKTPKLNKNKTKHRWVPSLVMGTSYLSETFPGEKGTVNDFIGEIRKNGFKDEAVKYWKKIENAVDLKEFYAVETVDPLARDLSQKVKAKTQKRKRAEPKSQSTKSQSIKSQTKKSQTKKK